MIFDCKTDGFIESPTDMISFLNEIEIVSKKYRLSISHEDVHGAFVIQSYNESNIKWLRAACKDY